MNLSFSKLFFILAFIFGLFAVMIIGRSVLIPLSMALLISFILFPVAQKLEAWGVNRLFAAFLSLLMMFLILGGFLTLFSTQIMNFSDQIAGFTEKLMDTLSEVIVYVNGNVNFIEDLNREELIEEGKSWLQESSGTFLQSTFSTTATLVTGAFTTVIFTFLILIYRDGLTKAFVSFGEEENRERIFRMLQKIQRVGKQYLSGMFILILILGFANSIGLLLIGIDNPFLFGFLAALLSIVPFVGTTIGAIIPALYAFISSDSLWVPVAVVIWFWAIQVIESNFLNPKIVGSSLNVNALVAIMSLLVGAAVWGVAGMILFLPFASILKVICEEFEQLKPIAMLISNDISGDEKKAAKTSMWIEKVKGWFK